MQWFHLLYTIRFVVSVLLMISTQAVIAAAPDAPRLVVQSAPAAPGSALAFSPDNALLASTANTQASVQIWQRKTGRLLCHLDRAARGNPAIAGFGIPAIAFSPDSLKVATATDDGNIQLWDLRRCEASNRIALTPRQRQPVRALATLANGRVLVLAGDGRFYLGDLFGGTGQLEAIAGESAESTMLLAHSQDGRVILEARIESPSTGAPLLPMKTFVVRDLANGRTDTLAALLGSATAPDLFASAALSPSGRWIAVHSGQELIVFDRESGRIEARARTSDTPQAGTSGPTSAPTVPSTTLDAALAKQRQRQLERLERKIKGLPPEEQAQLRQQVEEALEIAGNQARARADNTPIPNTLGDTSLLSAPWIGFSPDEQHVFRWNNAAALEAQAPGGAGALPTLEVRRRTEPQSVAKIALAGLSSASHSTTLIATSFAQSADRTLLALQTSGVGGAGFAIVDLAQRSLRAWSPDTGRAIALAWDSPGRLVSAHSLPTAMSDASLSLRAAPASPNQRLASAPATRFVRWDLRDGDVVQLDGGESMAHGAAGVSPDGGFAAQAVMARTGDGRPELRLMVHDLRNMHTLWQGQVIDLDGKPLFSVPLGCAIGAAGKHVIVALTNTSTPSAGAPRSGTNALHILIVEVGSGRVVARHELPFAAQRWLSAHGLNFSADGRHLWLPADNVLYVISVDPAQEIKRYAFNGEPHGLLSAQPAQLIATPKRDRPSRRADRRRAAELESSGESATSALEMAATFPLAPIPRHRRLAIGNGKGDLIAASAADNRIELHQVNASGSQPRILIGHTAPITALAFSPDDRWLASSAEDGSTLLWRVEQGAWVAKLYSFAEGTWVVVDRDGRFDTNNLEDIEQLHWVMPDDPLRALPLEVFMRDYYEPRLLPRMLAGEHFAPVRALTALNRLQPELRIERVESDPEQPNRASVTVRVQANPGGGDKGGEVMDLRLFRDGKLVAAEPAHGGNIALDAQGAARLRFDGIRLPADAARVQFSAYAFNGDLVKSATVRAQFVRPVPAARAKGRAYVISIGVNEHDSVVWKLNFAANDARRMRAVLGARLAAAGRYAEVVGIELISDTSGTHHATKARIAAVLASLAGQAVDASVLQGIPNAERLMPATPDDLVIVSFSGHGLPSPDGGYYLLPSDVGNAVDRELTPELKRRSLSTEELAAWFKPVDAGDLLLIVDACYSAASVDAQGFKPGPMGSRGLGQLAYDKGMRILAGSQADNVAMESGRLRHGLLTYALVSEGIEKAGADFRPRDSRIDAREWLSYGADRVPHLQQASDADEDSDPQRGASRRQASAITRATQRPKLFDFSRERPPPVLVIVE